MWVFFQLAALPVGLAEVKASPLDAVATHSDAAAQETPVRGSLLRCTSRHAAVPPDGLWLLITVSAEFTATHSLVVAQLIW